MAVKIHEMINEIWLIFNLELFIKNRNVNIQ